MHARVQILADSVEPMLPGVGEVNRDVGEGADHLEDMPTGAAAGGAATPTHSTQTLRNAMESLDTGGNPGQKNRATS